MRIFYLGYYPIDQIVACVYSNGRNGIEIVVFEDDGSVLKYMTKSEIEEQRSSLLIMT